MRPRPPKTRWAWPTKRSHSDFYRERRCGVTPAPQRLFIRELTGNQGADRIMGQSPQDFGACALLAQPRPWTGPRSAVRKERDGFMVWGDHAQSTTGRLGRRAPHEPRHIPRARGHHRASHCLRPLEVLPGHERRACEEASEEAVRGGTAQGGGHHRGGSVGRAGAGARRQLPDCPVVPVECQREGGRGEADPHLAGLRGVGEGVRPGGGPLCGRLHLRGGKGVQAGRRRAQVRQGVLQDQPERQEGEGEEPEAILPGKGQRSGSQDNTAVAAGGGAVEWAI